MLRGAALGIVELLPGVSGGTLALVLGIYRRLVEAVGRILDLLRALFGGGQVIATARQVPWAFIGALIAGMAPAMLAFSRVVDVLIERYPAELLGFFFAAVLVSSLLPLRRVAHWGPGELTAAVAAAATFLLLGLGSPPEDAAPPELWFLAVSGVISASVMILPGVSGSFMLLMLGPYPYVIAQLRAIPDSAAWVPLLTYAAGAALGVALVSGGLRRLLARAPTVTYAALAGLMIGSLRRLWPFLADPEGAAASHNLATAPRLPLAELGTLPQGALLPIVIATALGATVAAVGVWLAHPRGATADPHDA